MDPQVRFIDRSKQGGSHSINFMKLSDLRAGATIRPFPPCGSQFVLRAPESSDHEMDYTKMYWETKKDSVYKKINGEAN